MKNPAETLARWLAVLMIFGGMIALITGRWYGSAQAVELHASMSDQGGWSPMDLTVEVGQPLHLRLTSDDVVHGFAVGQSESPAIDLQPGVTAETTLLFSQPGKYTFYCTRWCGVNHWRMRGTIEVTGGDLPPAGEPPLYVELGIDPDQPHPAAFIPRETPSARRGAALGIDLPDEYLNEAYYLTHSPADAFQELRMRPLTEGLSYDEVWDLVAYIWSVNTSPEMLEQGRQLYSPNCAACHGESGAGDGVMAQALTDQITAESEHITGHTTLPPTDFTQARTMLGASPALLQGKILRGGMGTGMPYWGPIITEQQTWAMTSYLWTFQFDFQE